ncbi:cytochrome P450 [Nocardia sp. NPDC046473]|uniref:cytochrome P450 n=1 Tax=Nocardia sp. NPDC046473 TaxID=3155733 RepID=UPI0033FA1434
MTETPTVVTRMPKARPPGCPFDPPAELADIRVQAPLTRLVFPDGHRGWLATGHAAVRAVLSDPRFSARYELMHFLREDVDRLPPAQPGDLLGLDAPEHTRYRRLLAGKFTVRRMRQLTEFVEKIIREHLDAMELGGGPVDLVEAFARPIPGLVICELLGVPYTERDQFQQHIGNMSDPNNTPEQVMAAFVAGQEYIRDLVSAKRVAPTDDLLSDLTTADVTDDELCVIGALLLAAGLDTTASMLGLGTFALLTNPDQFAMLRDDPALADSAVEEMMRYVTVVHTGTRAALEDVEIDGQQIRAGETVALSMAAANRDPAKFEDPDRLDLSRNQVGHLGFGHGAHQCLGQQLVRVQLRVAFPALVTRFPTLRLAVPAAEVPLRDGVIFGVQRLPVTW